MENVIIDNRLVSSTTFAIRLLSFVKDVNVGDPSSEEEKEMLINVGNKLLKYQCLTATDENEINYLKRCCDFEKITQPILTTECGTKIFTIDDVTLYSCMRNPKMGEQVLEHHAKYFSNDRKPNANRIFFLSEIECSKYIEDNIPKYSQAQVNEIIKQIKSLNGENEKN